MTAVHIVSTADVRALIAKFGDRVPQKVQDTVIATEALELEAPGAGLLYFELLPLIDDMELARALAGKAKQVDGFDVLTIKTNTAGTLTYIPGGLLQEKRNMAALAARGQALFDYSDGHPGNLPNAELDRALASAVQADHPIAKLQQLEAPALASLLRRVSVRFNGDDGREEIPRAMLVAEALRGRMYQFFGVPEKASVSVGVVPPVPGLVPADADTLRTYFRFMPLRELLNDQRLVTENRDAYAEAMKQRLDEASVEELLRASGYRELPKAVGAGANKTASEAVEKRLAAELANRPDQDLTAFVEGCPWTDVVRAFLLGQLDSHRVENLTSKINKRLSEARNAQETFNASTWLSNLLTDDRVRNKGRVALVRKALAVH
jgi:hypothetical protein